MLEPEVSAVAGPGATEVELTVVLPCLDEAETLQTCVEKAFVGLSRAGVVGEVVVADNGSTDGSQQIATASGARVAAVPVRGYGAAIRGGLDAARGRYVLMADADDSYPLDEITPFVEQLRGGADLVMGNRFTGRIEPGAMPFLHRYLGNPVLSFLGRLFFKVPIGDFHCGIRAFRRDRALDLGLQTTGMEFASELVVRASLANWKIVEVPTRLQPDGRSRAPHLRTWRDGWRHLRFLLAFSPRWLFLYPALVLLLVGLAGMAVLAFGPRRLGGIGIDVQSLLAFATMTILGVQALGLAIVSRSYAAHLGLLPRSPRVERLLARFTLEYGVLAGTLLVLVGAGFFVAAFVMWGSTGFGQLDVASIRVPIFGMVLTIGGFQLLLVSFTMSLTRVGEP
ncbi:MAG TPA: glycosyltransferase family 2 protein [Candidatus Nanopelagicales bacterium]|nr:glycosyltransferase family 2 protein [Candidatus Nanopelagicales bacterium]